MRGNGRLLFLVGVYLRFAVGIGVWYAKRSNISSFEYVLGGAASARERFLDSRQPTVILFVVDP